MTNTLRGVRRDDVELFERMARDPITLIVKPLDRINSHNSIVGVSPREKLTSYMDEALVPADAQEREKGLPDQEPADNFNLMSISKLKLLEGILGPY